VIHDVGWLQARHQRPGLKGVVVVESRREFNGKVTDETRFYITSLVLLATAIGPMIRAHWAIENSLHWVMDNGLSRRRMPRQNRQRPSQLRNLPPHRLQSHPKAAGEGFNPHPAQKPQTGMTNISPES
jgi:hypothetical protein